MFLSLWKVKPSTLKLFGYINNKQRRGRGGHKKSTSLVLCVLQIPAQLTVNDIKYKIDDILLDTSLIVANDGKDLKSVAKMLMSTPSKRIDR